MNNINLEDALEKLEESRASTHIAFEAAGIYYFEYFPKDNYALEYSGKEDFYLEDRLDNYPDSWFEKNITHKDDEDVLRQAFIEMKNGARSSKCDIRNLMNGEYRWYRYNLTSIYNNKNEQVKVVCTAQDITENRKIQDIRDELSTVYERIPSWIFTCANDGKWKIIRTNQRIKDIIGYTEEEFEKSMNGEISRVIPESYQEMIEQKISEMMKKGAGSMTSYQTPVLHKNGGYTWLKVEIYLDNADNRETLYVSCSDITDYRKKQQELKDINTMYRLTTTEAKINLWEYDIVNDIMHNAHESASKHPGGEIIANFMQTMIDTDNIRYDCIEDFKDIFTQLKAGKKTVSKDIWIRKNDGDGWWCERITYANVFDEDNRPVKAFGLGRDVTEFKEIDRKISEEEILQNSIDNEGLLLKTRCNITTNRVESIYNGGLYTGTISDGDFTSFVDKLKSICFVTEDRLLVERMLSDSNLSSYALDNKIFSFQFRAGKDDGKFIWVNVTVKIYVTPESGQLIAFIYMYDINREKTMEIVMNRIVLDDYEILALIHVDINRMSSIYFRENTDLVSIDFNKPYNIGINSFIDQYIDKTERKQAKAGFTIDNIINQINKNGYYEASYGITDDNGIHMQKKWKFYFYDDDKNTIIYTRTDVTDIFRTQEEQKMALVDALTQAREASKAKTNFLSRMSHEIRTPMNAIIGMNTLAVQNIDKPEQLMDCLSKVGISARFLLSLINDILDMSRIESGKVTLRNVQFSLEDLVNNVNTIFYNQAEEKGIDYECIISSYTSPFYIGDAMKLQQIVVNLLGNSIKFTNAGGKVQLIIHQEQTINGRAYVSFSVNDTGVGIKKEKLDKIFDPFEQGDTTITTPYKGTGLGLAIAKNLVTMMGGTINVNSIESVGSEFVVRVPFDVVEGETAFDTNGLSLETLKTLIVDDDITICEHTKMLLEEMGMKAEWVESGLRAVETVQSRMMKNLFFDVILLDWKMPDMDGIETARRIRRLVGDDVTIIVMTAYDWAEIEEEAKKAGVNLLVTKPLFKTSIISVFESAFKKKKQLSYSYQEIQYDFTGRNIMLVEDHILNVEVAKRLLENKNANVIVAENGLRAIELFMEKPEYYFDAILMDIRMPVMDGLTATRSIRQLHKKGASLVPILAMSANAFDEDIDKSKAAGMNEHLSKPIEPAIMYAALDKWFKKNVYKD